MSWEEPRGGTPTLARRTAHADDAKDRADESSSVRPRARARWLVPALVGAALVLIGGGATAALVAGRDDPDPPTPAAASPSPGAPEESEEAAGPAVDQDTGLPLEPVSSDVRYRATIRCVEGGAFLLSNCPSVFVETMECPAGACRIAFFVGPGVADFRFGSPGTVVIPFRAGDPAIRYSGTDKGDPCPGPLTVNGTRQGDGGYEVRLVNGARAGEADGSCSKPSDAVFTMALTTTTP